MAAYRGHRSSSTDTQADDKCIVCCKVFTRKDKTLQCALCDSFFHIACQDIDEHLYESILKDKKKPNPVIQLYCSKQCNKAVAKYMSGVVHLEKEVKKLEESVTRINEKVSYVEKNVSHVSVRVSDLEKGVLSEGQVDSIRGIIREEIDVDKQEKMEFAEEIEKASEEKFSEAVTTAVKEMSERETRKKSFIVHNIPMSKSRNLSDRIAYDKRCFDKLCVKGLELKNTVEPRRITRLGKKDDEKRPMKVTLGEPSEVSAIIRAYSKAKDNEFFKNQNVTIASDRTPLERLEWKKLLNLRDQKQAMSDQMQDGAKWIIVGRRVVKDRGQMQLKTTETSEELDENQEEGPEGTLWG